MAKEIRTKEDMLVWRLGQMAEENAELELRLNRLVDEYNCTVDALSELRKREREASEKEELSEAHGGSDGKREGAASVTLGEMFKMRDLCDKLEVENTDLKKYAAAMDTFVSRTKLYMENGTVCLHPYTGKFAYSVVAGSTACLECGSCLRVLPDLGVVCAKKLSTWKTGENIRPNLNGEESENG
mgnify:CR=1 FL=1